MSAAEESGYQVDLIAKVPKDEPRLLAQSQMLERHAFERGPLLVPTEIFKQVYDFLIRRYVVFVTVIQDKELDAFEFGERADCMEYFR